MSHVLTAADLAEISQTMAEYDCGHWGLRIVAGSVDDGEVLPESRVWVDGSPTDNLLRGTSAVMVDRQGRPLVDLRGYAVAAGPGAMLMLIGSDEAEAGDDDGELVIVGACCYWRREI